MNKKAILYRLASWPNLTQLTFMYSIPFGGAAWLAGAPWANLRGCAQASQNVLRRLQALRATRQPNISDRGAGMARGVRRGLGLAGR